jgi:hypothetical protein
LIARCMESSIHFRIKKVGKHTSMVRLRSFYSREQKSYSRSHPQSRCSIFLPRNHKNPERGALSVCPTFSWGSSANHKKHEIGLLSPELFFEHERPTKPLTNSEASHGCVSSRNSKTIIVAHTRSSPLKVRCNSRLLRGGSESAQLTGGHPISLFQ